MRPSKGAATAHLPQWLVRELRACNRISPPPQTRPRLFAVEAHAPAHDAPRSKVSGTAQVFIGKTRRELFWPNGKRSRPPKSPTVDCSQPFGQTEVQWTLHLCTMTTADPCVPWVAM